MSLSTGNTVAIAIIPLRGTMKEASDQIPVSAPIFDSRISGSDSGSTGMAEGEEESTD